MIRLVKAILAAAAIVAFIFALSSVGGIEAGTVEPICGFARALAAFAVCGVCGVCYELAEVIG